MRTIALCALSLLAACNAQYPEGVISCSENNQCPGGWTCRTDGFCWSSADTVNNSLMAGTGGAGGSSARGAGEGGAGGAADPRPRAGASAAGTTAAGTSGAGEGGAGMSGAGMDGAGAGGSAPPEDRCAADPCAGMQGHRCDPETGDCVCVDDCATEHATKCEDAKIVECVRDAASCLRWVVQSSCPLNACAADGMSCQGCDNKCTPAGATTCSAAQLRTCVADASGCFDWSAAAPCATGRCDSASACFECTHQCAASSTDCQSGKQRSCTTDADGCRVWSTPTTCETNRCASSTECETCGGLDVCDFQCVDLDTDESNCGSCGRACGANDRCQSGRCECAGTVTRCVTFDYYVPGINGYGAINVAAYSGTQGNWLAYLDSSGNDNANRVVIHDAANNQLLWSSNLSTWYSGLAFEPSSPTLLYSSAGALYRRAQGSASPTTLFGSGVTYFALSPSGTTLAVWNGAGSITLYNYPALTVQRTLTVSIAVRAEIGMLEFSANGSYLAISGGYEKNQVQLYQVSNGSSKTLTATGANGTYSPAFSADGSELYIGGAYDDGDVYTFSTANGSLSRSRSLFNQYVYSVVRVPGFNQLMAGGYDGALRIFEASSDATVRWTAAETTAISRAVFSPDGKYMYSAHSSGSVSRVAVYRVQ